MTDREKLVGLVKEICNTVVKACGCSDMLPTYSFCKNAVYESIADYLITNGVTVQRPTDLTGKCGSCAHAEPTVAFGGSKCYIKCKNPEKKFKRPYAHLKQRTCKACKMYKPLPEDLKEE